MRYFNVVIANADKEIGEKWANMLAEMYFTVDICEDFSSLIYTLSQNKVHVIVCSSNVLDKNAVNVLLLTTMFFPNAKLVLVGEDLDVTYLTKSLKNILCKKEFDGNLRGLISTDFDDPGNERSYNERRFITLLSDHFLTRSQCNNIMTAAVPDNKPGYVVICIQTESQISAVLRVVNSTASKYKFAKVVQYSAAEVCIVLDNSPDTDRCLSIADDLRLMLLRNADTIFNIGISRPRMTPYELYICRKEALAAAKSSFLYGINSVVHVDYFDGSDLWYVYPEHKEKRLIEWALDGNGEGAVKMLDDIFEVLNKSEKFKQSLVNKICLRIWTELNIAAVSRVQSFDKALMDSISFGKVLTLKSLDEAYKFLKDGILLFAKEMDELIDIRREVLHMRLLQLRESGAEITLTGLTKTFHTTVNFMNSSIMKMENNNIFDFFIKGVESEKS